MSRHDLGQLTLRAGLRVTGSVSRFTKLVVAADTDGLSGKARRARELGIPIVDVATFMGPLAEFEQTRPGGL